MNFTLKQLRYLVAVAEENNICRAAEKLHISQPSLSTAINQLESQFDEQLFIRYKGRGVALTPTGRQFVAEARQLLLHSEEFEKNIDSLSDPQEHEITVGCYTTIAPFYIPRLLQQVGQASAGLTLRALEKNLDEIQEDLFNGRYELALLYDINLDPGLELRVMKQCRPYVIVSSAHPLATRKRVRLRELEKEPYILLDLPNSRDYFMKIFSGNRVEPNIRFRTRGFETVRGLVARQQGYSILNLQPFHDTTYDDGKVACIKIESKPEPLDIVLAHVQGLKLTRRATMISDIFRDFFANA